MKTDHKLELLISTDCFNNCGKSILLYAFCTSRFGNPTLKLAYTRSLMVKYPVWIQDRKWINST